jgi:hypothetical protein
MFKFGEKDLILDTRISEHHSLYIVTRNTFSNEAINKFEVELLAMDFQNGSFQNGVMIKSLIALLTHSEFVSGPKISSKGLKIIPIKNLILYSHWKYHTALYYELLGSNNE